MEQFSDNSDALIVNAVHALGGRKDILDQITGHAGQINANEGIDLDSATLSQINSWTQIVRSVASSHGIELVEEDVYTIAHGAQASFKIAA